jgi:hypothetical protein
MLLIAKYISGYKGLKVFLDEAYGHYLGYTYIEADHDCIIPWWIYIEMYRMRFADQYHPKHWHTTGLLNELVSPLSYDRHRIF